MSQQVFETCKVCDGRLKKINKKHALVQCDICSLIFCETKFTNEQFETVYDKLYNEKLNARYHKHSVTEYENLKKGIVKLGLNRSILLKRFVKSKSKVLEIGSGIGLVGYHLTYNKKGIDYTGIEIDEESHNKAKSLNINSIHGDYTVMKTLDECFDTIMLWEVLEHIQDLDVFFKLSYERLKKKGKIIISVPNYNKRLNYNTESENIYQSGPPVHLNFFTKESLFSVFKKYGFKIVFFREKKTPYFEKSITFFINTIKSIFGKYNGATLYLVAEKDE